ncbi:hypothetical protein R1sor_007603 [Riccia sorocarpa]|uniref:Retrotransposon gag domain-containing protein n=1 Tax=Riccia sorocarpa TaxID=122646 RepID=A0ABD3HTU7_9MARC
MVSSSFAGTSRGVGATGSAGAGTGAISAIGMAEIASGAGVVGIGDGVGAGTSTASTSASTSSTTALGVLPPPTNMISVLQSLATLIRAQPTGEMRSTKALESCVQKMGRFVGREVSQYLREYRCAMEMYLVSDTETIANFDLVSEPELRDRIREIARRYLTIPRGWESFERAMREEYLDEDSDRITRRTFLDWIETQLGRTLGLSELKREFEKRYSKLPLRERLTLDTRRTELFLRTADDVNTDRLCFMLADKVAEGGITFDWMRVDEAISVLTKQRRAVGVHYVVPVDFPRVEEPRVEFPPELYRSVDHMRVECTELATAVRDRVVHYQDGRLHLTATGEPLMTRWGRGGMRSFLPRPAGAGVVIAVPSAVVATPVLARAVVSLPKANVFAGQAISASSGCSSGSGTASSKVFIEVLRRGAESIRRATGWNDFVDVNTIHAFLDNKKHVTWEDAIVEEKRRRDVVEMDTGSSNVVGPRVTRRPGGDIAVDVPSSSRAPPSPIGPMEGVWHDVHVKGKAQKVTIHEKNKASAYKLAADIEAATDLKAILEKGILDARVEFSLRNIFGIAKREFHEFIIDVIKRKRQIVSDDYKSEFWARATDEVNVQLGGLSEPVTTLVDTGSEINVMSRAVYERSQWPIDLHHGWALRFANGVKKEMYGACPFVPVSLDDRHAVQFLAVRANHERNRRTLRDGATFRCEDFQSSLM